MKIIKDNKFFFIFISVMFLTVLIIDLCFYNSSIGIEKSMIFSDGEGYYAYLPAVFIHHDIFANFAHNIPQCHIEAINSNMLLNGQAFNKFPIGVAILQFPFFILTHFFVLLTKISQPNGYSLPYQISCALNCFFWWSIGVGFIYKIISKKFSKTNALITVIIFAFATNFLNYLTFNTLMGHIYSFSLIAIFIYFVLNEEQFKNKKLYSFILGFLLSIIFLIKAINISILIIYVLYKVSDIKSLKIRIKDILMREKLVFNCLGFFPLLILQIIYWYKVTGKLLLNTYYNEAFYWFSPKIISVLFGSTKGLFFYVPILLVIFFGFKLFKKYYCNIFLGSVVFLLVVTYFISAFWAGWFQGDSFGSRMFIDYYSIFMLIFSCVYSYISNSACLKKWFAAFITFCFLYTNFLFFMYIIKALPEESGLNNYKDLFSFRFIQGKYFARIGYLNNKKYLLQDAHFMLPYLEYPKGRYIVRIKGKELLKGLYNVITIPYAVDNLKINKTENDEIIFEFDIKEKVYYLWYLPKVPQNKNIHIDYITVEKQALNNEELNLFIDFKKYNKLYSDKTKK